VAVRPVAFAAVAVVGGVVKAMGYCYVDMIAIMLVLVVVTMVATAAAVGIKEPEVADVVAVAEVKTAGEVVLAEPMEMEMQNIAGLTFVRVVEAEQVV
jgi:hypothetical protein